MNVGDKVRITSKECFAWASRFDISKIEGVVKSTYDGSGFALVELSMDGKPFNPLLGSFQTAWNFWANEIEVIK